MEKKERNIKIRKLYKKGKTYQEIGKIFNASRQRIHQIVKGYSMGMEKSRRKWRKRWKSKLRNEVLNHYGGNPPKCAKCGIDNINCLEIDHINNNGAKERKGVQKTGEVFYLWLRKNNYPKNYQILCKNCNWIKYLESRGIVHS